MVKAMPEDAKKLASNVVQMKKNEPEWIFYDENGNRKVSATKLGQEIIKENPMLRLDTLSQGARFDKAAGTWRLDKLSEFLDTIITEKLESVGKWSQGKLSEVKHYVLIKVYHPEMIESPFEHADPNLITFANGTYNLVTDTLQPHRPEDYILQNHPYDLKMKSGKDLKTVDWLAHLTGDPISANFLMEFIGYCFYHRYSPFQALIILQGTGQNGKTTFIEFVKQILGKRNVSNVALQDLANKDNRFTGSQLYQKEANMFADLDDSFLKTTGQLKALTGDDTTFAEFKGKDGFSFMNFAKLIFSANKLPKFSDFTSGFIRRLYVVPFPKKIDNNFKKEFDLNQIYDEIPAFSYQCLRAFKRAIDRDSLSKSPSMIAAKEQWLKDSDNIARFIEDRCRIELDTNGGDSSRNIYKAYQDYCWEENIKPFSQPEFTRRLEAQGIPRKKVQFNNTRISRYLHLFVEDS